MPVAVVGELVAFVGHAPHELRPPLGVATQHEEGSGHLLAPQDIQNDRRRARVGAVVEGETDDAVGSGQVRQDRPEDPGIAMPGAERCQARDQAGQAQPDHTETATRPMTL